jgi:hypothetical protein
MAFAVNASPCLDKHTTGTWGGGGAEADVKLHTLLTEPNCHVHALAALFLARVTSTHGKGVVWVIAALWA